MAIRRIIAAVWVCLFLLPAVSCKDREGHQGQAVFREVPEIAEIKPQKPVKIKLKRNAEGNYTWELSGDDAEKVIETDRKLREKLVKQQMSKVK